MVLRLGKKFVVNSCFFNLHSLIVLMLLIRKDKKGDENEEFKSSSIFSFKNYLSQETAILNIFGVRR